MGQELPYFIASVDVRAGKTGFISSSGYCLATLVRLPQGGQEVAVVVLGAQSNASRFLETRNLFTWMSINPGARIASAGMWIEARASASPKVMLSTRPCEILTDPGPRMSAPSKMCCAAIVREEEPAWPICIDPRMAVTDS